MLSSHHSPCGSVSNGDPGNHSKQVQWSAKERRTSHSRPRLDSSKSTSPKTRKPSRLTVKYDLGQLQTWLETEQWVDSQLQELYQAMLQECVSPTEPFISELLCRLKSLRRLSRPQK
ncbi:protein phosphatase 1 regulatory subunit 14D isoform X3 [Notamacropus eugenii]|uniref:protein phosphatase 1 regulatory subunit 14D isoform X3 n=1 Tax=Notamacropus eugenii TaxID=9315 RepID=UPI003B6767F8